MPEDLPSTMENPPAVGSLAALEAGDSAAGHAVDEEESSTPRREPVPELGDGLSPTRLRRRNRRRRNHPPGDVAAPVDRVRWWTRRLLAGVGLLLFAGCLYGLLDGGSLPVWRLRNKDKATPIPGAVAVVIDPGHGGWDTGAVAQGVREKDLNLDVGLRVARVLEGRGVRIKLTRDDDHFIPLSIRAQIANAQPGAIFVSIHFNDAPAEGHGASHANGIETFYSEFKEAPPTGAWTLASLLGGQAPAAGGAQPDPARAVREGRDLADSIQSSLISGTAATDRGIKERSLYVTRRVQGPAVLVEGGFVSHPAEARLLGDPGYRQRLAESIADGILKYLTSAHGPAVGSPLAAAHGGGE